MTKKELIVAMLRRLDHQQEANDLDNDRYSSTHVTFGYAAVYISERFNGKGLDVGINWSALGTVSIAETWKMALDLQHAAGLAELVQYIIDSEGENA